MKRSSGNRLRIDGKLLDTETGEIKTAVKAEGPPDTIFDMEAGIARGVFDGLGIQVPDGIAQSKSASVDAVKHYYTGLGLFDDGKFSEAVEYYRQASIEDPEYNKPRAGLEESYKFLRDFRKMRYQREINNLLDKADILRTRLQREPWTTYADFITEAYQQGAIDNETLNKQAEELGLFSGETPAVCAWHLQTILYETADLSMEYFEDYELAGHMYREITDISKQARTRWPDAPFLPEIIYQELLVTFFQDKWEASLELSGELMMNYPDYRMMWAIEDFYENSLNELEKAE